MFATSTPLHSIALPRTHDRVAPPIEWNIWTSEVVSSLVMSR